MDGRAVKSDLSASVFLVDAINADEVKDPGKMFVMDPVFFTPMDKKARERHFAGRGRRISGPGFVGRIFYPFSPKSGFT